MGGLIIIKNVKVNNLIRNNYVYGNLRMENTFTSSTCERYGREDMPMIEILEHTNFSGTHTWEVNFNTSNVYDIDEVEREFKLFITIVRGIEKIERGE